MARRTPTDPGAAGHDLDRELALLAGAGRAESFGPGFEDRVMARVAAERRGSVPSRSTRSAVVRYLEPSVFRWATAAVVVLALAASIFVADSFRWRTVTAPAGASVEHALPDGSSVMLHPGSTLRFRPFRGRSERRVLLVGEALADVRPDGLPFVVETFNAEIEVTGTRFNVRAWPDDEAGETSVALIEGSVVLRAASGEPDPGAVTLAAAEVALRAGETARVSAEGRAAAVDDAPSPPDAANWTRGGLSFSNRPLADVLRTLERRYDTRIEADATVTAGRTATYLNPEEPALVDVLDALSFALGLRYGRTANGWILVPATTPATPDA